MVTTSEYSRQSTSHSAMERMRYNLNANNFNEDSSKLILSFMCTIDLSISDKQLGVELFPIFYIKQYIRLHIYLYITYISQLSYHLHISIIQPLPHLNIGLYLFARKKPVLKLEV